MSKGGVASGEELEVDLDTLLVREIGQFGRFQQRVMAAAALVAVFTGWSAVEYIFTAAAVSTRCLIPECEVAGGTQFSPPWLAHAVPSAGAGGSLDGCRRYALRAPNVTVYGADGADGACPASLFDTDTIVPCDAYVFNDTNTIVYDLELACDEWRRSLVGAVRNLGKLVAMPITGFVSDRWGRRAALVVTAVNAAWLGSLRARARSYAGFVTGEFFEAVLGSGTFNCAFILLLELVGPKYRVLSSAVVTSSGGVGLMAVAPLAWLFPYWRHLILALFVPQFVCIFFIWIMPESIRWYQSKGRLDEADALIKKVARINGKNISEKTLMELKKIAEAQINKSTDKKENEPWLIIQVFQHKPILIRCLIAPVWWITTNLASFGLSINAVNMAGNKYVNFALVSAMEIPGVWLAVLLLDRAGRRPVLAGGFWLCALCQLGYIFISKDMVGASLFVYMVGKVSIVMVMSAVYVYTAELFPTQCRQSLFGYCATLGYVGSIAAPLTPAMGAVSAQWVPFALFGALALAAGLLALLAPETRGAALPDTLRQAARLGSHRHRHRHRHRDHTTQPHAETTGPSAS